VIVTVIVVIKVVAVDRECTCKKPGIRCQFVLCDVFLDSQ
jgi:hypothetical protein